MTEDTVLIDCGGCKQGIEVHAYDLPTCPRCGWDAFTPDELEAPREEVQEV